MLRKSVAVMVALPTEGVDRNPIAVRTSSRWSPSPSPRRAWIEISEEPYTRWFGPEVALPTEGVDRNLDLAGNIRLGVVALPTEGVDRNKTLLCFSVAALPSPSPRRAWIEIRPWLPSWASP